MAVVVATMPVPVMLMVTLGRAGSLDTIVSIALCGPPADGVKVTVNEHVCPANTWVQAVGTKSGMFDVMLVMVRVAVPVLEITTGAEVELLPTVTVPNASEVGATPMIGTGEMVAVF